MEPSCAAEPPAARAQPQTTPRIRSSGSPRSRRRRRSRRHSLDAPTSLGDAVAIEVVLDIVRGGSARAPYAALVAAFRIGERTETPVAAPAIAVTRRARVVL